MPRLRRSEIAWLTLAAMAPIALGVAMHLDHEAVRTAPPRVVTIAVHDAFPVPVAVPTPAPAEPAAAPIPEPAPPPVTEFTYGPSFAFVIHDERPLIVLDPAPEESWAVTRPVITHDEWSEVHVRREVRVEDLPTRIGERIGESYDLFSAAEHRCTATVGTPYLFADASGELLDADDEGAGEPAERAATTWTEGRRLLVAPLVIDGDCTGATWARRVGMPEARVYTKLDRPTRAQVQLARRSYLALPELVDARQEFDAFMAMDTSDTAPAVAPKLRQRMRSTAWAQRTGELALVTHEIDGEEFGGCGGLTPRMGLARVSDDGATLDGVIDDVHDTLEIVLDLDGDGTPEVLVNPNGSWGALQVLSPDPDGTWTRRTALELQPYFGCPC